MAVGREWGGSLPDPGGTVQEEERYQNVSLGDYVGVLKRRKWTFGVTVVLVPLIAVLFSLMQSRSYEASAKVLLNGQQLAMTVNGLANSGLSEDAARFAQTQVDVARSPVVASRTLRALHLADRTPADLLASSGVVSKSNADVLVFSVTNSDADLARRLVNEYARQFTIYGAELEARPVAQALEDVRSRVASLRAQGDKGSALLTSLRAEEGQLVTIQAVQGPTSSVLHQAIDASQVQPQPSLNVLLGVILGLVLGTTLAFVRDATDTRVRSVDEIVDALGLEVLGLVPDLSTGTGASTNGPVVLAEPQGTAAEAFRMTRTKLALANLTRQAQVIMFTSAVENDGKSTVIGNLAAALARGGRRVILVDFDLRRPSLLRLFGLQSHDGLTTVALRALSVDDALVRVSLADSPDVETTSEGKNGPRPQVPDLVAQTVANSSTRQSPRSPESSVEIDSVWALPYEGAGELLLLPAGPTPPNPGEFVETRAVHKIFDDLRQRGDLILVDAPPLLRVSDATSLATMVDGIVVVTNLNLARRPVLSELRRALGNLPATKLGLVLTGVTPAETAYTSSRAAIEQSQERSGEHGPRLGDNASSVVEAREERPSSAT